MKLIHKFNPKEHQGILEIYDDKPSFKFLELDQTHSDRVVHYKDILDRSSLIDADGIIASYEELSHTPIGVRTADCLPVLLLGEKSVALVHAGWRGVYNKILLSPQIQKINPTHAYIGPSIQKQAFEVQEDFKQYFSDEKFYHQSADKLFFDLQLAAIEQMQNTYKNIKITDSKICTFSENHYNSYRRNKTNQRNWNIFKI